MSIREPSLEGTIYLLHFVDKNTRQTKPYKHAAHYRGFAEDLERRIGQHEEANGKSSPLLRAAHNKGITFVVAKTEPGTRTRERQLKHQGGASRSCPVCRLEKELEYRHWLPRGDEIRAELRALGVEPKL